MKRLAFAPLLFFYFAFACGTTESTPSSSPAPQGDAAADAGGGSPAGDAASSSSCKVGPVPEDVRTRLSLDAFYVKHLFVGALSIVASEKVPDGALCTAKDVVSNMLAFRPELLDRLAEKKIRLAILGETEVTTDIPEYATLEPKDYWDKRARGLGATLERPAVSGAEENVLCYASDVYKGESILVHEFSHAVFDIAIALYEPSMEARLQAAYDAALAAGKYQDTYAATTMQEYWAEGVQDWFDTNLTASPPNGIHNEIGTRAQLRTYDSELAALVSEVFGDGSWRYACPTQ